MHPSTRALSFLLAVILTTACGTRVIPPRMPPARVIPNIAIPMAPLPPAHGRVLLDVEDGPADVTALTDRPVVGQSGMRATVGGRLCTTPCVAVLPYGHYKLFLSTVRHGETRGDSDDLVVDRDLLVYRRALGQIKPADFGRPGPVAAIVIGVVVLSAGSSAVAIEDSNARAAVMATGILGAAMILGGILWLSQSRAVEQSGSTTAWSP